MRTLHTRLVRLACATVMLMITVMLLLAVPAKADTNCGLGTYYDPPTNSCLAIPNPAAPIPYYPPGGYGYGPYGGYQSHYDQFCFSGFFFSYCSGNSTY